MEKSEYDALPTTNNEVIYDARSGLNKGALVDFALRDCYMKRAKEMKSGYYNIRYTPNGDEIKEYVQDSRKAFISSVKALLTILIPELLSNPRVGPQVKEIEEKSTENFKEYCYKEKEIKDGKLEETGKFYLPEEDESIIVKITNKDGTTGFANERGVWNHKVKRYWEEEVEIWTLMLAQLNIAIHEEDYFAEK